MMDFVSAAANGIGKKEEMASIIPSGVTIVFAGTQEKLITTHECYLTKKFDVLPAAMSGPWREEEDVTIVLVEQTKKTFIAQNCYLTKTSDFLCSVRDSVNRKSRQL